MEASFVTGWPAAASRRPTRRSRSEGSSWLSTHVDDGTKSLTREVSATRDKRRTVGRTLARRSGAAVHGVWLLAATLSLRGVSGLQVQQWNLKQVAKQLSAAALAVGCGTLAPGACVAENELAALGAKGFDASLIDATCMTNNCEKAARSCLESGDCRKGLTCTAKCMGDNACITGCFAKYGNDAMNEFLECSVDANGCIKIAILPPGPDTAADAPQPPAPLVADFDPKSLQGDWYKVLGWNSRYDCFDCQKNSFSLKNSAGPDKQKNTFAVDVGFRMPRPPRAPGSSPSSYALQLTEELVFDPPAKKAPSSSSSKGTFAFVSSSSDKTVKLAPLGEVGAPGGPKRHASSVGHLFGLTFWENWSVLAQNGPSDPEEWKLVYYTGKTTQNTYTGAFVYARTAEPKPETMDAVYAAARKAGFDPTTFCSVNNDCCKESAFQELPPGVLTADASKPLSRRDKGLFVGAASAAEDPLFFDDLDGRPSTAPAPKELSRLESLLNDASEYLEDPHSTSKWVFDQQRKVGDVANRR